MTDIHFVIEEAPEGDYVARAVGEDIFHRGRRLANPARATARCGALPLCRCRAAQPHSPALYPRGSAPGMRIPRDLSGADLVKRPGKLGYAISRQTGNYLRLIRNEGGEHHVAVPNHDPLRIDTLSAILDSVAKHRGVSRDELLELLLG